MAKPTASELIAALRDIEINVDDAKRFRTAPEYTAFVGKTVEIVIPTLGATYGIEPGIDYVRGKVLGKALQLDNVFKTQGKNIPRHLPVPAALAAAVGEWRNLAHDLRIAVEEHVRKNSLP